MRTAVLVLTLLLAGCAETIPEEMDRANAAAVRDVASRIERGELKDDKAIQAAWTKATGDSRGGVLTRRFDPEYQRSDMEGKASLLRWLADDIERRPFVEDLLGAFACIAVGLVFRPELDRLVVKIKGLQK